MGLTLLSVTISPRLLLRQNRNHCRLPSAAANSSLLLLFSRRFNSASNRGTEALGRAGRKLGSERVASC